MAVVDTKAWKAFRLGDLFGSALHGNWVNPKLLDEDDAGYCIVSASTVENGVGSVRYACPDSKNLIPSGVITWGKQSPFFAYQTEPTISGQGVYFYKVGALSESAALFLCSVMQAVVASRYNYQDCLIGEKCDNEVVMLPATPDGQPDWVYMDTYMSEVLKKEEVFAEHLASLTAEAVADGHKLDTSGWKAFRIGELFEVLLAKGDIQPKQVADGTIPLVSAGNEDNGIVSFIDAAGDGVSEMFSVGCITVSMFGKAFYQPECFYAVSHGRINVLRSKIEFNSIVGVFLAACLSHVLGSKYDYATMCTQKKLVSEEICLPVTSDGQPDWAWMEQYMQQQMDKAEALVEHLDAVWN